MVGTLKLNNSRWNEPQGFFIGGSQCLASVRIWLSFLSFDFLPTKPPPCSKLHKFRQRAVLAPPSLSSAQSRSPLINLRNREVGREILHFRWLVTKAKAPTWTRIANPHQKKNRVFGVGDCVVCSHVLYIHQKRWQSAHWTSLARAAQHAPTPPTPHSWW